MAGVSHVELIPGAPSGLLGAPFVLQHRTSALTTTSATRTLAAAAAVPVGNMLVVSGIAAAAAASLTSVTDPRGNTWTKIQRTTPGGNVVFLAFTVVTNAISLNDNVTLTFTSHTRFAAELNEWTGALGLDVYVTNSAASTTTPTTGATAALGRIGELAVAVFGLDEGGTAQTPSHGANFAQLGTAQTATTGAGDGAGIEEYTTASVQPLGTGTVTAGATLTTGKAYAAIVATFVTVPRARSRRFFENVGLTANQPGIWGQKGTRTAFNTENTTDSVTHAWALSEAAASPATVADTGSSPLALTVNGTGYFGISFFGGGTGLLGLIANESMPDFAAVSGRRVFSAAARMSTLTDNFSLEAWIYIPTDRAYSTRCIAHNGDNLGDGYGIWLNGADGRVMGMGGDPGGATPTADLTTLSASVYKYVTGPVLTKGKLHHVVLRRTSGAWTMRVDKTTYDDGNTVAPAAVSAKCCIGGVPQNPALDGAVSNVVFIPSALNNTRVDARFDAAAPVSLITPRGRRFLDNVGLTQIMPEERLAPKFRGASFTDQAINANGASTAKPAGTVDGDLIFLAFRSTLSTTVTPPTGFVEITTNWSGSRVFWKIANNEPATFTVTTDNTYSGVQLDCIVYYDTEGIDDWDLTTGLSGASITSGSVDPTVVNDGVLIIVGGANAGNVDPATGFTERMETGAATLKRWEFQDRLPDRSPLGQLGPFTMATAGGSTYNILLVALKSKRSVRRRGRRFMDNTAIIDALTQTQTNAFETWRNDPGVYPTVVLADSPVAYYRLGEAGGAGSAVDSSTNNNPATYINTPTLGVAGLLSQGADTSATFTAASSQRATAAHIAAHDVVDVFSIEAWVKTTSAGATLGILSRGNNGPYLRLASGTVQFVRSNLALVAASTQRVDDGSPHHLVWTKSGATNHFYIDGAEIFPTVTNATMTTPATVGITVGADYNGTAAWREFFQGTLDEVAFYSTVLSAARVTVHYNAGSKAGILSESILEAPWTLSQQNVVIGDEPVVVGNVTDTLDTDQTAVLAITEAVSETTDLVQTGDQPGMIAELGDTYDVSQTDVPTITAETIKEFVTVVQTMLIAMDTLGDETDPIRLSQTLTITNDDFVVGNVLEIRRLTQELVLSIIDQIRIDIETHTIQQTNILSILEAFDELLVSQTMSFSMVEFIPQTLDTLTLLMSNVISISDDAEVVRVLATNILTIMENTELSNIVQTNIPAISEILVVPGSGFNETMTLVQTNVPSITDQVLVFGYDELKITQTNVPRISERILSPPVAPPSTLDGVEFSRVILPYSPLTFTLDTGVAASLPINWQLSGPTGDLPSGHFVLEIGDEIVYVVSRFGSTVTVIRGWSMTTPASHSAGATVTWPTHYDMALASPLAGLPGDWLTFFDATQAYLNGQRYAFHVDQVLSVGKRTAAEPNKLDGPQPWRASPIVGVTEAVPGGVCQPARLLAAMNTGDRCVVRYENNVAPTGVFELGPRQVMFMLWGGNIETSDTVPVSVPPGGNLYEMSGLFTDTDPQAGGINMTYYAQKGYRWISYQAVNGGVLKNPDLTAAKAAGFDPNVGVGVWGVVYTLSDFHDFGQRLGSQAVALGAQHVIVDAEFVLEGTGPTHGAQAIIDGCRDGGWTGPVHLSTLGSPSDPNAFTFNMDVESFLDTGGGVFPQAYSNITPDYDPINCKTYWMRVGGKVGGDVPVPAGKLNYTIGLYSDVLGRPTGDQEVALLNAAGVNRNFSIFLAETALLADVTALEYFTGGAATNDPSGTGGSPSASNNAFLRFDAAGNLDMTNPNAFIYDGKSTLNMTYANSASLIRAIEFGADRYWTIPLAEGGKAKSGVNLGILVLRNGFSDIPIWSSPDWRNGDYNYMGFDDPDAMFMQVVYRYHFVPASDDVFGPNATWTDPGYEVSTAFAMFLTPGQFIPAGNHPPNPTDSGGGGGGGGIFKPPPAPPPEIPGHQVILLKKVKK